MQFSGGLGDSRLQTCLWLRAMHAFSLGHFDSTLVRAEWKFPLVGFPSACFYGTTLYGEVK